MRPLLLFLLTMSACDPESAESLEFRGAPPQAGSSLRVMTANTALMGITLSVPPLTIDWFAEKFDESMESRAHAIAAGILAGDQDVVVLNEVWSDEAREILIDELSARYPHYVAEIAAPPPAFPVTFPIPSWLLPPGVSEYLVDPLGSGLMIFSRYRFLPLGDKEWNEADCSDCTFWGLNQGNPLAADDFAFVEYESCHEFDCLASKGVGLVHIDAPGKSAWVAFTHMQADAAFNQQYANDRASQYEQIEKLLSFVLEEPGLLGERVFLMGDLNTPAGTFEWSDHFFPGTDTPFFACGDHPSCSDPAYMTDAWGFETSPDDPGVTQGGHRLDYVVHSGADGTLCMQHAMLAYESASDGVNFHSDHKPVRIDFNEPAQWCSPNVDSPDTSRRPEELVFGTEDCDYDPASIAPPCHQDEVRGPTQGAKITHPGSFQWFRITQGGSYVFSISDNDSLVDVKYDIYESEDLSRPLTAIDEDVPVPTPVAVLSGEQFYLPSPPYYIRAYATVGGVPNRTASNIPYTLRVHQNLCRSPIDACLIEPNHEEDYAWPDQSGSILGVEDIYYKFRTSGVKDGRLAPGSPSMPDPPHFPVEEFHMESPFASWGCLTEPVVEEYDPDTFAFIDTFDWVAAEDDGPYDEDADGMIMGHYTAEELPGQTPDELKFYFLHVHRACLPAMSSYVEQ